MRLVSAGMFLAASLWGQGAESWTIQGTVYDRSSNEPIRKATLVTVASGQGPRETRVSGLDALTDQNGVFTLSAERPGTYRIRVRHPRYLESDDQTITVSAGQKVTGLRIGLTPQGVISGRVVDEDGDPFAYGMVVVHQLTWSKGRRVFRTVGNDEIDDRGEYRIAGLAKGRYVVQVVPSMAMQRQGSAGKTVYLPTLYPGVTQWSATRMISLDAGQQLASMDIAVQKGPVYRLAGTVTGSSGTDGGAMWRISLRPAGDEGEVGRSLMTNTRRDGTFELRSVPPGRYVVQVAGQRSRLIDVAPVDVTDRDLEGLVLEGPASVRLSGKMIWDKDAEGKNFPSVILETDPAGGVFFAGTSKGDGEISIEGVPPGIVLLARVAPMQPGNLYLKAVQDATREFPGGQFDPAQVAGGKLELVVSDKAAQVAGNLVGEGAKEPDQVTVALVPDGRDMNDRARRSLGVKVDQAGSFRIGNIPPGEYRLCAWEGVPDGAWQNPAFLEAVLSKGKPIKLAEGEQQSLAVEWMSRDQMVPILSRLGIE